MESWRYLSVFGLLVACSSPVQPLQTAPPGVVFTYPVDAQVDVPQGTRIVVTFSDPVEATALGPCSGSGTAITGAFCLVGPNGVVDTPAMVVGDDGKTVQFAAAPLDEGGAYAVYVKSDLAPTASNLPTGPLFHFKVRSNKPNSAVPTLIAVNGGDPASPESFRPMLESSTIRLLFSEPLDPRTVVLGAGAIELVDGTGAAVTASIVTDGIHISIDPKADLVAGSTYTVKVGTKVTDLAGQPVTATTVKLSPHDSRGGSPPIPQVLRTRQAGDPGATSGRTGAKPNVITIDKPLIGSQASNVEPSSLATELGDPKALGGPIAFTIRKGQRLKASGLDVKLGGAIPAKLSTGDIEIELLTDGGGRLYRNPWQAADQRPENDRAPLYADLSMDVAVYAVDRTGNAVLAQTVLGLQGVGVVQATDGVLDIETVASMELGLLGVTRAPTNLVLELITDTTTTTVPPDATAPTLVATYPGQNVHDLPVDQGVELIFDEPIDLDRARAGGVVLQTAAGAPVPSVIESHGSAIVVRPLARLARATTYKVIMPDVADVAGNKLAAASSLDFSTENVANTGSPMAVTALHPGVGCALTGATATSPGRCTNGDGGDDLYKPFMLPSDEPIEATFTQPVVPASVALGTVCNSGSVRVEELDSGGACSAVVKGTLIVHDRSIAFMPDTPWVDGKHYRLTLVSGNNSSCAAGELCGISDAASFDVLASMDGTGASGGPDLIANFVGAKPTGATYLLAETGPLTDLNGNGAVDNTEVPDDDNRAALRITGTGGLVSSATFTGPDCLPATPENEGCIYLAGAMPVDMQPLQMNCTLPGGGSATSCIPVTIAPELMYATSVSMNASAIITISTDTKTSIMRVREPASGPVTGYIYDDNGPTMVVSLDLYMDAPDMSITLSSHDLHSKKLTATLKGPVTFLPDGRIAIAVANVADVPVTINISTPVGGANVDLTVPAGEMKLKLLSRPLRGVAP